LTSTYILPRYINYVLEFEMFNIKRERDGEDKEGLALN
jgi:hypothetical protein